MAKLLKLRRGTTTQHSSFTGAEGEVTIDTTKDTAVVHDGSQAGGRPLAREDLNNVSSATITGRLGTGSIARAKLAADIIDSTKLADDAVAKEHIADNSVDEARLQISNTGSNGQYLQKQSGNTGGLTWGTVDLTTLSASNLTSGTIPDARFPSTLPAVSGANLTGIEAFVSGMIILWSGASNAIPSGFVLCNGSNSTPDLRNRFVIGAGDSYSVNATGGSSTISTNISHSHSTPNHSHGMNGHTHSTPNHSHSVNNHTHSISGSVSGNTNNTGGHSHNCSAWKYGSTQSDGTRFMRHNQGYQNYNLSTSNSGNHNHSFSGSFSGNSGNSAPNTNNSGASNTGGANGNTTSSGASNTGNSGSGNSTSVLNPYYALCYIMKT